MRRLYLLCALLLFCPAILSAKPLSPTTEKNLVSLLTQWMQREHVPGAILGVVQDGQLVFVHGSGVANIEIQSPVTPTTVFRIASMSKNVTGLGVLALRDAGKLRLDDLVERYVPQLATWQYPTQDSPRLTVRDLLAHLGGFVTDDPWGDRQLDMSVADFEVFLRNDVSFARVPQTAFEYSNLGYAILGHVVSKSAGQSYQDYLRGKVFQPLGMRSTTFEVNDVPLKQRALGYRWESQRHIPEPVLGDGVFGAMGGLHTNAEDYTRYVAFLLQAWPPRDDVDTGQVKRASVRELALGYGFAEGQAHDADCATASVYGNGLSVSVDCRLGFSLEHAGGLPGYGSDVLLLPAANTAVFVFSNRTYAPAWEITAPLATELKTAGLLASAVTKESAAMQQAFAIAEQIFIKETWPQTSAIWANNFWLDRGSELRTQELRALKEQQGGQCKFLQRASQHRMAGELRWQCAKGTIIGTLTLAPIRSMQIQSLEFSVE
jgi:serine-type D-Ala-D-Ala carboxypeptidase/endopeptidase